MKKFVKLLLVLVMLPLVTSINASHVGAQDNERLIVGMEGAYPPYNWTQSDDSNDALPIADSNDFANGYDVQIARRIGEALGREVIVAKYEWEGLIPALMSDRIDLIIAGMSPTEERAQAIDFTDPYYELQFAIVVNADSEYANATSLEDFSGARLTGQLSTLHYDLITQIQDVQQEQAMRSFPVMRVALESGRIDGYISEVPEAESATSVNEELAYIIPEPNFDVDTADKTLAIGIKKGNTELLDLVNEALTSITDDERTEFLEQAIVNQPANQE